MFAVAGVIAMFVISAIDYRKWKHLSVRFAWFCVFLLFLVITPLGTEHNGSQRWLFIFQPSEFMKFGIAIYCAYMIERDTFDVSDVRRLTPYIFILAVITGLMMLEPHVSGCIIIIAIAGVVMLVGGLNVKLFGMLGITLGGLGLVFLKLFMPNRWIRVVSFLDPFADLSSDGYQVVQGLYAIALGGPFGRGLGQSVQKTTFLPEPYNDFIFTIICEELGFLGALAVIALFVCIIYNGIKIAFRAQDRFGMLAVIGIMTQIAVQTLFNIAVATSSIPCTGISLPFFSYGGTSLMVLLAEMGFVLSVSRYGAQPNLENET